MAFNQKRSENYLNLSSRWKSDCPFFISFLLNMSNIPPQKFAMYSPMLSQHAPSGDLDHLTLYEEPRDPWDEYNSGLRSFKSFLFHFEMFLGKATFFPPDLVCKIIFFVLIN